MLIANAGSKLNSKPAAQTMRSVYISVENNECCVNTGRQLIPMKFSWWRNLNPNYHDDIKEINAAIAALPSRVDEHGRRWLRCDYAALQRIITNIIAARTQTVAPVAFMRLYVRRAMVALASTRLLPRDCLREIAAHAGCDENVELNALFKKYVVLEQITGLYLRGFTDGHMGPRMRVNEVKDNSTGFHSWYAINVGDDSMTSLSMHYHVQCAEYPTPHFCTWLYNTESYLLEWPTKPAPADTSRAFKLQFEAPGGAASIEFVHKRLDKYDCVRKLNHHAH